MKGQRGRGIERPQRVISVGKARDARHATSTVVALFNPSPLFHWAPPPPPPPPPYD